MLKTMVNNPNNQQIDWMIDNEEIEKQISISITKIFNWHYVEKSSFELIFYPQESDIPIVQKPVSASFLGNSVSLNSALKITYTSNEKVVILKLLEIKNNTRTLVGQFRIDLDILRDKNVQYFPFAKDQVLQINLYVPTKPSSRPSSYYSSNNVRSSKHNRYTLHPTARQTPDKILESRRRVNSKYQEASPKRQYGNFYGPAYEYEQDQPRIRRNFSQKVFSLLQEVKSIKEDLIKTGPRPNLESIVQERSNHVRIDSFGTPPSQAQAHQKKSLSDSKFKVYRTMTTPAFKSDEYGNTVSQSIQKQQHKHRLILKTLDVVPCEEYYENPRQKKEQVHDSYRAQSRPSQWSQQVEQVKRASTAETGWKYNNDYYQPRTK